MICPECNLENPIGTDVCIRCGTELTKEESSAPALHRTNQVWNTDIEIEQNQANSRLAMIVLGASAALLLGLIVALCVMLPALGDSLIGLQEQGQSFIERIDEFLEFVADTNLDWSEPVPESYAAIPEGTDEDYIDLFEEFLEKAYDDDYADLRRLSERYYDEFAAFRFEGFTDWQLADCSARTIQALDKLRRGSDLSVVPEDPAVTHNILWLEGCAELYAVTEYLYEHYGILYYDPHIPEFYIWLLPITQAELEVEYDLTAQLIGAEPSYTEGDSIPYLSYTNHTPFQLDITFYYDYETDEGYFYEEIPFSTILSEETVSIPLQGKPTDREWQVSWFLNNCYVDGIDIYEYYW